MPSIMRWRCFVLGNSELLESYSESLTKMANLKSIEQGIEKPSNSASFVIGATEYHMLLNEEIDVEAERKKIEEELKYLRGFLISVDKKLSNERFISGAPEQVVRMEQQKKADAEVKIRTLEENLGSIGS